jgi:hypothetical protein
MRTGWVILVAACTNAPAPIVPDEPGRGSTACDPSAYPCGPYGVEPGAVIDDLSFVGRPDGSDATIPATVIHLADLRAAKAIALLGCAEWCVPCNQEQPQLATLAAGYGSDVAFVEAIGQNAQFGPADLATVDRWAKKYQLGFAVAADPTGTLDPYFPMPAYPMQMVVRTRDMVITWADNGADPAALQAQIDAALQ